MSADDPSDPSEGEDKKDDPAAREERRKKYSLLSRELMMKGKKMPPGPAKNSVLAKAKNAKAVADALGYNPEAAAAAKKAFDDQ
eukprot:CAMPEP_0181325158 /NCGR_PEP_ID=MMETSP1101-20121128/20769_1 /TAXON_ID=46948 /ORGANISM="Rhodomonas abbreviata, Strain Caron Lab Isolate" /LENGTH=83 /DNA_ID=CAMNT_0023433433 /DNA_START=333 /DNA_END=584 /DNA_ORIENTATION=-